VKRYNSTDVRWLIQGFLVVIQVLDIDVDRTVGYDTNLIVSSASAYLISREGLF
jgi:hypothetical protein